MSIRETLQTALRMAYEAYEAAGTAQEADAAERRISQLEAELADCWD